MTDDNAVPFFPNEAASEDHTEALLDAALAATFPASDAVALPLEAAAPARAVNSDGNPGTLPGRVRR